MWLITDNGTKSYCTSEHMTAKHSNIYVAGLTGISNEYTEYTGGPVKIVRGV